MPTKSMTEPTENDGAPVTEPTEKLVYAPPVLERHEGWVDVIGASI